MDMQELHQRYEESKQYKDRWLALYQGLYDFVLPDRNAFNVKWNYEDTGRPTTEQIWDDTAMLAADERAGDIQALLIPKDRIWGKYAMDPHMFEDQEIEAVKPTIDEMNTRIMFYINQSNLSRIAYGSTSDLVGGTGVIWAESPSDQNPVMFRSIPAVSTYIEQTSEDVVGTSWFQIKIIGYKLIKMFPDMDGKVKTTIMENPEDTYLLTYGQIELEEDKFYIYITIPDIDPFYVLWDKERSYKQIIVFRDKVRPGESEGRGIGVDMLPSIKDLNHMVRDDRKSLSFKADPTMFYDNSSMFNPHSVRKWAGAMIARGPNSRNPIEAMQMPSYPEVNQKIVDLQQKIQKGFQVDPLGSVDSSVKSATEISIRENRAQRSSATNMSRIINELPRQIFETSAKMLAERRLLTKNRRIGSISVEKLRFDFQSPLFDIQKQENINNLQNNLQLKQQYLGEGAAMATIDVGEVNEYLTENTNLPAKLFRTKDDMNKLMQAMGEQQQPGAQPTPTTTASSAELPQATPEQF